MWSEEEIGRAATRACRLEASAEKPGNVTPLHGFVEMGYADFLASAEAIGPVMGAAGRRSVGETILHGVQATRAAARANTNLGTVLLFAPIARAAALGSPAPESARSPAVAERDAASLRSRLRQVLRELDVRDAELTYEAIREASPGGMGRVAEQDLAQAPSVSLREAMRLAAAHDSVAQEYATDFETTFAIGLPLRRALAHAGVEDGEATTELFLELLARRPDTLIERKFGPSTAAEVSRRAGSVLASGPRGSLERRAAIQEFDPWLRRQERRLNPGTTADLVAVVLFVRLLTEQAPE